MAMGLVIARDSITSEKTSGWSLRVLITLDLVTEDLVIPRGLVPEDTSGWSAALCWEVVVLREGIFVVG